MRLTSFLLASWAARLAETASNPENGAIDSLAVIAVDTRALPDSPSGGYAPKYVDCPSTRPKVRIAEGLSSEETSWLHRRRNNTVEPLRTLLSRASIPSFNATAYIDRIRDNATSLPNVAIAFSGGGYRALMNGAGFLSAADSRNNESGPISGLLQSSTYIAGLSGGSWLVGSVFANNFSTVPSLQKGSDGSAVWRFDRSILKGPKESGIGLLNTFDYWKEIVNSVADKGDDWPTTITDFWGRALSYQLVNASEGGPAYTLSSIANTQLFEDAETPFPILIADGRAPGQHVISLNATVYEFNPYEFGTWDPTTYGFAPIRYLASNFTNGTIDSDEKCVRGFDQIGFVMGTSSSLFNQFILQNITSIGASADIPPFVTDAVEKLLKGLSEDEYDIARYTPNPFYKWDPTSASLNTNETQLSLVDGGEDLQNIPLHPLIQPVRGVDIIFAIDSSADTTYNWPNGTALRATYDRINSDIGNNTLFPYVPSAETFINQRLNQRPTLFGCDANNFTLSNGSTVPPLVFYIPNAPYTSLSNVSTYDLSYYIDERDDIILNGLNGATQGNSTLDNEWPVCVACAILSRTWWKANETVPEACDKCFERYCWNGTVDNTAVKSYEPSLLIDRESKTQEEEEDAASTLHGGRAVAVSIGLTVLLTLFW